MEIKKFVAGLLVLVGLIALLAAPGFAATPTCTVDKVGSSTVYTFVWLTDTAATPLWQGSRQFYFNPDKAKEMLATALTAMANNKKVNVNLPTYGAYSKIIECFMVPN
jgi:hypothetical protein